MFTLGSASEYLHKYVPIRISRSIFYMDKLVQKHRSLYTSDQLHERISTPSIVYNYARDLFTTASVLLVANIINSAHTVQHRSANYIAN